MFPRDIKKTDRKHLVILWDDGHESRYALESLRKSCPCASCRAARARTATAENNPLRVLNSGSLPEDLDVLEAEVVGRYALQFRWNDGHHEGIYTFHFLRELCECDACRGS